MNDETKPDGDAVKNDEQAAQAAKAAGVRPLAAGAQLIVINGDPVIIQARPLWAQWRYLRAIFSGLTEKRLAAMVKAKLVRCHKNGDSKQGCAEYSVDDIDRVYGQEALGKKPRAVRREVPDARTA